MKYCCICGKEINSEFETHNPQPLCLREDIESRCCYDCNFNYVIPARLCGLKNLSKDEIKAFVYGVDKVLKENK